MTDPAARQAIYTEFGIAYSQNVAAVEDLADALAASRAQLEQMRALVEQAEFGMTLREDVLTPEERIAREAQRNLLALFKDALAAIPDPEASSRG